MQQPLPIGFTLAWAAGIGLLWADTKYHWWTLTHDGWGLVVVLGGVTMFLTGLGTAFWVARIAAATQAPGAVTKWIDHPWLFSLVVFWAVFPPLWFMAEHACYEYDVVTNVRHFDATGPGRVTLPAGPSKEKADFLASLRATQDRASKIWAGIGALILGVAAFMRPDAHPSAGAPPPLGAPAASAGRSLSAQP